MSRFKYFVLLANMRTGSNLFEQNIRMYDGFSCHGELFNPHFIGFPNTHDLHGVSLTDREKKPQKLLNKWLSKEGGMPGFRLFSDHDPRILAHVLEDRDCAKIVLTRNPLDSFVSHAIARATDQWKLTDVAKRKTARISFDFIAFRSYLTRLEDYLRDIRSTLQRTGQTGFYLGFEDLNDPEVYNGLVRYLGGTEKRSDLGDKIVRQNPEGLRDKVENFDEMMAQVRAIDLLGSDAVPVLEPVRNPGSKNFVAGTSVPLLFMAMEKGGHAQVAQWVASHQEGSKLQTEMNQRQLGDWLTETPVRRSFTVIAHPLERAYRAFYDHIFCSGDSLFPWIRTTLENHYGMVLPPKSACEAPNRSVLENSGYGPAEHGAAFIEFLRFLKGNLQGQTRARVDQSWASQNAILQGYSRLVFADVICREETLAADLRRIESELDLEPKPLPKDTRPQPVFSLSDIFTPEMNRLVRDTYVRDFQMFGFSDWG